MLRRRRSRRPVARHSLRTVADLLAMFRGSPIHRLAHRPLRFVVCNIDTGWNVCEMCGREHRVWVTTDADWKRLPVRQRRKHLCTYCFRRLARWSRSRVRSSGI